MQSTQFLIPEAQDEAMETFQREFPITSKSVSEDGKKMTYKLGICKYGAELSYLKRARDIINNNNLPLAAQTFKNVAGHNFGTVTLLITYKP